MTSPAKILIVEDQPNECEALARLLRFENYAIATANNPDVALTHVTEPIDLVISDLRMGAGSGIDLLQRWKQLRPATPFIMMTAYGDVDSAVGAMKLGAEDYLSKPVNPDELLLLIEKCLEHRRKDATIAQLQQRLDERLGFEAIIGHSPAMLRIFASARRAAQTDSTVLITGESGTGKELVAQAMHQNSPRKHQPFVVVNMAAVPEHLVESELFGHVKGSFTGALESRIGCFEAASGGTIFIDEIGDFLLASQAKLLRVLENHCVTPVGSNALRQVEVRVLTATSRNLEQMVAEGTFREDLYYRLNVVNLHLPPLRERREDIPLLLEHYSRKFAERTGRTNLTFDPALRHYLEAHAWPGNVRQLRNALESMVVLTTSDRLTMDDVPAILASDIHGPHQLALPTGMKLELLEREAVEQAVAKHRGNRTHAAAALGISVRTLQRKLKAWGIHQPHDNANCDADGDEMVLEYAAARQRRRGRD